MGDLNHEYEADLIRDDEHEHWVLGTVDVTALFQQYQNQTDQISKPIPLETRIQEVLAFTDVLLLAKDQHSQTKISVFGEELLENVSDHQVQVLLNKVPAKCPDFTKDDFMAIVDIVSAVDERNMSPKLAKLQLLTLAAGMSPFKSNVVEGIADL